MSKQPATKIIFEVASLYFLFVLFTILHVKYGGYVAYHVFARPYTDNKIIGQYYYVIGMIVNLFFIYICVSVYKINIKSTFNVCKFNIGLVLKLFIIQSAITFILYFYIRKNYIINAVSFFIEALQGKKLIIYQTIFKPNLYSSYLLFHILEIINILIIGPITEEFIYRGVIYNKLKSISSIKIAAIITAVLFSCSHIYSYGFKIHVIDFIINGLLLVYCYEKTKTLIAPVLMHSLYNAYITILKPILKINSAMLLDIIFFVTALIILIIELINVKRRNAFNEIQTNSLPHVQE